MQVHWNRVQYLDSSDAEEEHEQPRGPAGLEEEEEQQDERGRDDEHQRGLGLQLHDLGFGILLPAQRISVLVRLERRNDRGDFNYLVTFAEIN